LTAHGANSNFLPVVLKRLVSLETSDQSSASVTALEETLSKSFLISADMAHAVHPNYSAKYEEKHKPKLNHGVVLKVDLMHAMVHVRLMPMLIMRRILLAWY
jgi:aspartyl aminopeptidase